MRKGLSLHYWHPEGQLIQGCWHIIPKFPSRGGWKRGSSSTTNRTPMDGTDDERWVFQQSSIPFPWIERKMSCSCKDQADGKETRFNDSCRGLRNNQDEHRTRLKQPLNEDIFNWLSFFYNIIAAYTKSSNMVTGTVSYSAYYIAYK